MAKSWIQSVCEILFYIQAIESLTITLCENSALGYTNVTCPTDETISLKGLTYGESSCQDTNNSDICHSTINAYFQTRCLGQNSCTLQVDKLFNKNCQRPPRRLKVNFKCFFSLVFWLVNSYDVYTCANSLVEGKCPPSKETIHVEHVKSHSDESRCGSIDTLSVKRRLVALCNYKRRCVPAATRQSSLFHERYAMLSYVCKGPTAPLTTERIQPITSDEEIDITVISAENVTEKSLKSTEQSRTYVVNPTLVNVTSVDDGSSILGVTIGIPVAILVVICIIVVILIIR